MYKTIPKQELDEDRQFSIITEYFEEVYGVPHLSSYDYNILRTLFAPLKTRERRLVE